MSLVTSLMRRSPATSGDEHGSTPKHLNWVMLTALGIGATIGAGIFAMPGIIASKAGPAGILSFLITGLVIVAVAMCYEKFSGRVTNGVSAYSYVYHSLGELFAWVVAFGLFLEYSLGSSAVAVAWAEYLKNAVGYTLPEFFNGSHTVDGVFHLGCNVVALSVIVLVTAILILGGVAKSAKLNLFLVVLKLTLLATFLAVGLKHVNPANWTPFMPKGWDGVLSGAALAVFPYVGFDALFTFARESKTTRDTKVATYTCVILVALLYVFVMAVATGLAPCFIDGHENSLFVGSEAAAPLAQLLSAAGEGWCSKFISFGAVLGIFNVLLVLCMGGPRIFRNMAEDGLLPPVFAKVNKGNPTVGIALNGTIVALTAGFVPFGEIAHMMVLGTLVAFIFVGIGALRLKLVNPIVSLIAILGCGVLTTHLEPNVLKLYCVSLPLGLIIYFSYGFRHSKLAKTAANALAEATSKKEEKVEA